MGTKTDRLEMRLTREQKELLERASVLTGQPLTGFALSHLLEDAQQVVERHERTVLSRRDWERFLTLIESAPEPTPALKQAWRRHKNRRG